MSKLTLAALFTVFTISAVTSASAQYQPRSGLLLGIYAQGTQRGLRVNGFLNGYTADQVLNRGDYITGVASPNTGVFQIYSVNNLETAKEAIGPNVDAAIEIFRPGFGYDYAWVTFSPVYGPAAAASGAPKQMKAVFRSEQARPGAKSMFLRAKGQSQNGAVQDQPIHSGPIDRPIDRPIRRPGSQTRPGNGGPSDLFRRHN